MKLSVFVVTYNQEKYISQCLDSILMQRVNFDYEIIVGDDCSNDNTRTICEQYVAKYPNIKLLTNNNNIGIGRNWKRVLCACSGEYIAMCEGDDYWIDSLKLQKQIDILEADKEVGYVFTKNFVLNKDGNLSESASWDKTIPNVMDIHLLTKLLLPSHTQTVCFRSSCLPKPYPIEMECADYCCDIFLKYLVASKCKIVYINQPTAVYRLGGVTSVEADMEAYIKKRRYEVKKLDELTLHKYAYFLIRQWKVFDYELYLLFYLKRNEKLKAAKYLLLRGIYSLFYGPRTNGHNMMLFKHFFKSICVKEYY